MGHETEQITESYYAKLTDEKRASLFDEIASNKTFNPTALSVEQKAEFFDAIFAKVSRG